MADKPSASHAPFHAAEQPSNRFDKVAGNHIQQLSSSPATTSGFPFFFFQQPRNTLTGSMASNFQPSNQPTTAMAPPAPKEAKKVDISSLMSPPDHALDSFSQNQSRSHNATIVLNNDGVAPKQPLPMSPPISPYTHHDPSNNAPRTPPSHAIKDPVLYPVDETSPSSPPQPPLFAPTEFESHKRIVDSHVRARSSDIFTGVSPPRREDYELALTFRSQVMKHFTNNPIGWLRKERALLRADRAASSHRFKSIMPAKPIVAKPVRTNRADRVSKPHGSAPRPIRTNATTGVSGSPSVHTHIARPSARRPSATPEPSRRIVAPNREDKDFNSLPDYCPPLDSLPSKSNSLKVDWKGQPIDLSKDPQQHMLHPDEVILAGNLRLDCATYLTSKRRMFERRLQCLRTGKEFRKTDAQQACKIDVNKASKLWTAFDKVGWLDAHWVRRFL